MLTTYSLNLSLRCLSQELSSQDIWRKLKTQREWMVIKALWQFSNLPQSSKHQYGRVSIRMLTSFTSSWRVESLRLLDRVQMFLIRRALKFLDSFTADIQSGRRHISSMSSCSRVTMLSSLRFQQVTKILLQTSRWYVTWLVGIFMRHLNQLM